MTEVREDDVLGRKGRYGLGGTGKGGLRLCQQECFRHLRAVDTEDCESPEEGRDRCRLCDK